MLFIIKQFITFLKLLHNEGSDQKIALALVLGFFSATSPALSLQGLIFILIAVFFRVQFGAFLLSWLVFAIIFIPIAPLLDQIGYSLLSIDSLKEFYTAAQKSSIVASTRFYNTLVLGGLVFASLLAVPLYYASKWCLKTYREQVIDYFKKTKAYHALKASILFKIVGFYEKYKTL